MLKYNKNNYKTIINNQVDGYFAWSTSFISEFTGQNQILEFIIYVCVCGITFIFNPLGTLFTEM
jgi:hypothetical protein